MNDADSIQVSSCWIISQILWLYHLWLWKRYRDRIKLFQSSRWLVDSKWNATNREWMSLLILAKYVTNSHLLHCDWLSSDRSSNCHYFLPFLSLQHMNYSDNTQLSSKSGWVCEPMRTGNPKMILGDQLNLLRRAPMSIRERGMKWVLPLIVTSFL